MADIAVSIPHGGGSIKESSNIRSNNAKSAFTYCWLGGTATTGPDNNLFISVRLQQNPNFAVIDLYTYNLRDYSTHGKVTKRSRIYGLGGQAFSNNTSDFKDRMINIERINSTTALLKIPYTEDESTYYVIEVDESTYDCGVYVFEETAGGLYQTTNSDPGNAAASCHLFMQRVEDNVVITHDQDGNTRGYLNQRVWNSSAKTLTKTRVASSDGGSSYLDIDNFSSAYGAQYLPTYGINSGGGTAINPATWSTAASSSSPYISAVEGRDGKWHFRFTQNGSTSWSSLRYPSYYCFTYIPSSTGGDLATSGFSQSWGLTGGFTPASNNSGYGNLANNNGSFGVFLPINVVPSAVSNASTNYPQFYMKSWAEIGGYSMIVHEDGTANTEMNYENSVSGNSTWRGKQAVWLDSNHFFVHTNTNINSYWTGNSQYQKYFVNQYIDETYTDNQSNGNIASSYAWQTMASNAGSQWTKIDDYTLTCQGFNYIHNIWAPE